MKPKCTVNEIFRQAAPGYLSKNKVPYHHLKAINSITKCKTAELGGHWEACNSCGVTKVHYNSCGNRHCPSCQGANRERWILQRKFDLFNVKHFHLTFTIPFELRALFKHNKKMLYNLLFKAVKETLLSFGADPRSKLEAKLGAIAILHTWTQKMEFHPHIHCIVPAGGIDKNGLWKSVKRKKFLFDVKQLSKVFKVKLCEFILAIKAKLIIQNTGIKDVNTLINKVLSKKWVVNAKPSFNGSDQVLEYLGRYTHKIAISNYRILEANKHKVLFTYRNRAKGDRKESMSLPTFEFINRFLQHVLPPRFVKIRHFGYFATRIKKQCLTEIKRQLEEVVFQKKDKISIQEVLKITLGMDIKKCKDCGKGEMVVYHILNPIRAAPRKLPLGKSFE